MVINFNYEPLYLKIKEKFGTIGAFAEKMDLTRVQMSNKLNNHSMWDQFDIIEAARLLDIGVADIGYYFFMEE